MTSCIKWDWTRQEWTFRHPLKISERERRAGSSRACGQCSRAQQEGPSWVHYQQPAEQICLWEQRMLSYRPWKRGLVVLPLYLPESPGERDVGIAFPCCFHAALSRGLWASIGGADKQALRGKNCKLHSFQWYAPNRRGAVSQNTFYRLTGSLRKRPQMN